MAYIILPHRWTRQPPSPVEIDRANPLAQGLRGGILPMLPAATTYNPFSGKRLTNATYGLSQLSVLNQNGFLASRGNVSSSNFNSEVLTGFATSSPVSLFSILIGNGATTNTAQSRIMDNAGGGFVPVGISLGDGANARIIGKWRDSGGTTRDFGSAAETAQESLGVYRCLARVKSGAQTLWVNGRQSSAAASVSGTFQYAPDWLQSSVDSGIDVGLVLVWNRYLSDADAYALTTNPWQIFKPLTRRIWVPVSAGGASGTLAYTNANDTLSADGTTTVTGTVAYTNANDTLAASGSPIIVGILAATNANDTLSAAGSVGDSITGTLAYTNANDTLAASGTTTVIGTVAYTNANDTSAASGTTTVIGTVAYTNADDTLSASGVAGTVIGTLAYTNANDTLNATGDAGAGEAGYAGSGYPVYPVKPKKRVKQQPRIADIIEKSMREVYEGVIEEAPQQIKKQAAKIVRPFIEKGTKPTTIPSSNTINWQAMEKDAARVSEMLELWQSEMQALEDEEILMLLMAA